MSRATLRIGDYEVERHILRYVEAELQRFPHRKRRLKQLEDGIVRATANVEPGMPRAPGPGNPTASRAVALMQDQEVAHLRLWLFTIESTLKELTEEQQTIVRLSYFENQLRSEGVAARLNMHFTTMYRSRNLALVAFVIAIVGDHAVRTAAANIPLIPEGPTGVD